MFVYSRRTFLTALAAATVSLGAFSACAAPSKKAAKTAFTWNSQSRVSIALPQNASLPEKTAAQELDNYLTKITGGDFKVVAENAASTRSAIYVGETAFAKKAGVDAKAMASEAWRIKTSNGSLVLAGGGTRGTLYATYTFLEKFAGVRWWNPWEETVPSPRVLAIPTLDARGKPSFSYRDIYMTYGGDEGRFAIRNRLDRNGDSPIGAQYGGSRDYGPPYHVHTFFFILDPKKYYAAHPDWFLVPGGGEPNVSNAQLAMSNPEMRKEFLRLLKDIIRKSNQAAKEKGLPAPDVFSVSQEDNGVKFTGPNDAALVAENGGAESAILLDFINFLADGIKDEFPGAYIDTLAYFSGEKAPTKIRPRDNVVIRLTDTTSNMLLPVTDPRNHVFRDNIAAWGKLTKNLRVWDYAITFSYVGLPLPTESTYPADLRYWKANNVDGIFVEHEFPVQADRRDFKIWLQCKMFENPNLNYDALVREFTDGFYGPAGKDVRAYFLALDAEAKRVGKAKGFEDVTWFVPARMYNYLPLDFVIRAEAMMDKAEAAAGDSRVLARRVRHARMSLDRFALMFHRKFLQQWQSEGKDAAKFPLDQEKIAARLSQTWNEQIDIRFPEAQRATEHEQANGEIKHLSAPVLAVPARFKDAPAGSVETYSPYKTRNASNIAKVVKDPESEIGIAARLLMSDVPEKERAQYTVPMPFGVYDTVGKTNPATGEIKVEDIPSAGYHWYKIGDAKLTGNDYVYFFWSWIIQLDIPDLYDAAKPDQQYEVWAEVKFSGPSYPHGKADEPDAISVARIVLRRK